MFFRCKNLTPADFYKPTPYNFETKNQIWLSQLTDAHDNFCDCNTPFSHLLSSIFPPGHQDRNLTITQILQRDFQQKCHSGGDAGKSGGEAAADLSTKEDTTNIKEEEKYSEGEIEKLIIAAENAQKR